MIRICNRCGRFHNGKDVTVEEAFVTMKTMFNGIDSHTHYNTFIQEILTLSLIVTNVSTNASNLPYNIIYMFSLYARDKITLNDYIDYLTEYFTFKRLRGEI